MKKIPLIMLTTLAITGCGGSSEDETEVKVPSNLLPTINIEQNFTVKEQKPLVIAATASDSDGAISSYLWQQISGPSLIFDNTDSDNITVTSPDITSDSIAVIRLTVTDNLGANTTADITINITRKVSNVTISGLITDQPIANAQLLFSIGEQTIEATADENGQYQVTLEVDDSDKAQLVTVQGLGINEQDFVEFKSVLGSMDKLTIDAGEDQQLIADENFAVNITNLSTAQYVLLKAANNNQTIESDEQLEALTKQINPDRLLDLAAAIKIVVDNEGFELPEGIESTLELISDDAVADQFLADAEQQEPGIVEETKEEIINDEDITPKLNPLTNVYLFANPSNAFSRIDNQILKLDLSNKTGSLISFIQYDFTWTRNASGDIILSFATDDSGWNNYCYQDSCSYTLLTRSYSFVTASDKSPIFFITDNIKLNSDENAQIVTTSFTKEATTLSGTIPISTEMLADNKIALTLPKKSIAFDIKTESDLLLTLISAPVTFNADGSASYVDIENKENNINWQIIDNGILRLSVAQSDNHFGFSADYYAVNDFAGNLRFISQVSASETFKNSVVSFGGLLAQYQTIDIPDEQSFEGRFELVEAPDDQDTFSLVFDAESSGYQESYYYDNDGKLQSSKTPFNWEINSNSINIAYYYDSEKNEYVGFCNEEESNCYKWRARELEIVQSSEQGFVWRITNEFLFSINNEEPTALTSRTIYGYTAQFKRIDTTPADKQGTFYPATNDSAVELVLNANGIGSYMDHNGATDITWSSYKNSYRILFNDWEAQIYSEYLDCDGDGNTELVEIRKVYNRLDIVDISEPDTTDIKWQRTLQTTEHGFDVNNNNAYCNVAYKEVTEEPETTRVYTPDTLSAVDFSFNNYALTTQFIQYQDDAQNSINLNGVTVTLNDNGSGSVTSESILSGALSWQQNDKETLVALNGMSINYIGQITVDGVRQRAIAKTLYDGKETIGIQNIIKDASPDFEFSAPYGYIQLYGNYEPDIFSVIGSIFNMNFDGTDNYGTYNLLNNRLNITRWFLHYDENNDGLPDDFNNNGIPDKHPDTANYDISKTELCINENPLCEIYNERHYKVIYETDELQYMMRNAKWYFSVNADDYQSDGTYYQSVGGIFIFEKNYVSGKVTTNSVNNIDDNLLINRSNRLNKSALQ